MSEPPFKVRALYEYGSSHEDDLNFPSGQVITVTEEEDTDWYFGEYIDATGATKSGIFPRNFVERYEPEPPPRPSRSTRGRKAAPSTQEPQAVGDRQPHPLTEAAAGHSIKASTEEERALQANVAEKQKSTVTEGRPSLESRRFSAIAPKAAADGSQIPAQTDAQPLSVEKPVASSFKDRIAAFNKPAAAPVTPAKPASLTAGGTNFVHKPFVAPPPSRDSYVPPPREAPQTIFRREAEAEKHAAAQSLPERSPQASGDNDDEAQVKPTSLKERIALLQKQQLEAAMRYSDPSQKREPAKKPPKPQRQATGSSDKYAEGVSSATPDVQTTDSRDTGHASATTNDTSHQNEGLSSDTVHAGPLPPTRHARINDDPADDANDADQSGIDDAAEDPEDQPKTHENVHRKSQIHPLPSLPGASLTADHSSAIPDQVTAASDDNGSAEEADIDPELKRRMEIRDRMAKMSGGMGMHGMFGFPGGVPKPAVGDKQNKKIPAGDVHKMPAADTNEQQATPQPTESSSQHLKIRLPALAAPQERISDISNTEEPLSNSPTDRKSVEAGDDVGMDLVEPTTPVPEAEPGKRLSNSPRAVPAFRIPTLTTDESDLPPRSPPPLPRNLLPLERSTLSPSIGSESDDEMSMHPDSPTAKRNTNVFERSLQNPEPSSPVPPPPSLPRTASKRVGPVHAPLPGIELPSTSLPEGPTTDNGSPVTPMLNDEASQWTSTTRSRPPPPPPPSQAPPAPLLSRQSTGDPKTLKSLHTASHHVSDDEATAYEGDYDTDMASTATHKTAIRPQSREHGNPRALPDTVVVGQHKPTPSNLPPPVPRMPPAQATANPDNTRPAVPRVAPPPIPIARVQGSEPDDQYDSDRYEASPKDTIGQDMTIPESGSVASPVSIRESDASYPTTGPAGRRPNAPSRKSTDISSYAETSAIQRFDSGELQPPPHSPGAGARESLDGSRHFASTRRSVEQGRTSTDLGYIARDIDPGKSSRWWLEANGVPPVFRNRTDITYEMEESRTTKRGGKTVVARDVYVLFQDYSQTIVTARYDAAAAAGAPHDASLEQRHEPPPPRLRQDQLEAAHARFGRRIAEAAAARAGTTVGDGQPLALVLELLRPLPGALAPVGTRAFGAPVYVNLANASVQQHDEIRAGDVVSFRNARFQGHRGPMHQKYSVDVGRGSGSGSGSGSGAGGGAGVGSSTGAGAGADYHVGIVVDWDGTKKKVRVWEQGRESRKVKVESFKLGDLRSGEVKVWRVVGRDWVNWETPTPATTTTTTPSAS